MIPSNTVADMVVFSVIIKSKQGESFVISIIKTKGKDSSVNNRQQSAKKCVIS